MERPRPWRLQRWKFRRSRRTKIWWWTRMRRKRWIIVTTALRVLYSLTNGYDSRKSVGSVLAKLRSFVRSHQETGDGRQ